MSKLAVLPGLFHKPFPTHLLPYTPLPQAKISVCMARRYKCMHSDLLKARVCRNMCANALCCFYSCLFGWQILNAAASGRRSLLSLDRRAASRGKTRKISLPHQTACCCR